jgi:hypothetical protein
MRLTVTISPEFLPELSSYPAENILPYAQGAKKRAIGPPGQYGQGQYE